MRFPEMKKMGNNFWQESKFWTPSPDYASEGGDCLYLSDGYPSITPSYVCNTILWHNTHCVCFERNKFPIYVRRIGNQNGVIFLYCISVFESLWILIQIILDTKVWEKMNLNVVVDRFTYYLDGNAEYRSLTVLMFSVKQHPL